jgi:transcription antitermination factor NusG
MASGGWKWESEGEAVIGAQASTCCGMASPGTAERWYAVQTRSRHEKKVAARLQDSGVYTYLPLVPQVHHWSDRRKLIDVPLFPGYAFIRAANYTQTAATVVRTGGVVTIVGAGARGTAIPDEQIAAIQTVLAQQFPCTTQPFLKIGQRVRVRGGALDGLQGILLARKGETSLVISVEMIQRSLAVRIDGFDVEPV